MAKSTDTSKDESTGKTTPDAANSEPPEERVDEIEEGSREGRSGERVARIRGGLVYDDFDEDDYDYYYEDEPEYEPVAGNGSGGDREDHEAHRERVSMARRRRLDEELDFDDGYEDYDRARPVRSRRRRRRRLFDADTGERVFDEGSSLGRAIAVTYLSPLRLFADVTSSFATSVIDGADDDRYDRPRRRRAGESRRREPRDGPSRRPRGRSRPPRWADDTTDFANDVVNGFVDAFEDAVDIPRRAVEDVYDTYDRPPRRRRRRPRDPGRRLEPAGRR